MRSRAASRAAVACLLLAATTSVAAAERSADALVSAVLDAQRTVGFVLRARVVVSRTSRDREPVVSQIRIAGRRDGDVFRTLFQVFWPDRFKGSAVYFERAATGEPRGFGLTPPRDVWPLEGDALRRPLVGSDLLVEDLVENFWRWPRHVLVGADRVDDDQCTIVESHAPSETPHAATVRSCISERKQMALRVEKLDETRRVTRRMTVVRTRRGAGGRWSATSLQFEVPGTERSTVVEFTRAERDIDVPLNWFSLETIKRLAAGS
jgi:outer membrane lipoprotein-sorting protein